MVRRVYISALALALTLVPVTFGASACSCGSTADAAAGTGSGGCSNSGSQPIQPCSPSAQDSNEFGKIGVQQAGPQKTVYWGVYPTDSVGRYTVTVTVDGQVYDKKNQAYPPHGTAPYDASNKRYLQSGGAFEITGTVTRSGKDEEGFYFQCTLA
jgi:hypothetical protein